MMRSHGTDTPRETYQFGKKGDRIYDAISKLFPSTSRTIPLCLCYSWDVTANQSTMMCAYMIKWSFIHLKKCGQNIRKLLIDFTIQ